MTMIDVFISEEKIVHNHDEASDFRLVDGHLIITVASIDVAIYAPGAWRCAATKRCTSKDAA